MYKLFKNLIQAVRFLHVPRAEDLPYWGSPPIQFVYESTALLSGGTYTWADSPSLISPVRPVRPNVLYFFRNVSLVADVEELDFTANIIVNPKFNVHLQSDSKAPLFREPLQMNKFYDQFDYRLWWSSQQADDKLYGTFAGTVNQGPTLIGKPSITLKAIITAQEVSDEYFVNQFRTNPYPRMPTAAEGEETHE